MSLVCDFVSPSISYVIISFIALKLKVTSPYTFLEMFSCLVLVFAGGFGGNVGHDPHLLYTLSAIQVLALFDKIDVLDIEKVSNCILLYVVNGNIENVSYDPFLVSGTTAAF